MKKGSWVTLPEQIAGFDTALIAAKEALREATRFGIIEVAGV